jgi:hypothetical protein
MKLWSDQLHNQQLQDLQDHLEELKNSHLQKLILLVTRDELWEELLMRWNETYIDSQKIRLRLLWYKKTELYTLYVDNSQQLFDCLKRAIAEGITKPTKEFIVNLLKSAGKKHWNDSDI